MPRSNRWQQDAQRHRKGGREEEEDRKLVNVDENNDGLKTLHKIVGNVVQLLFDLQETIFSIQFHPFELFFRTNSNENCYRQLLTIENFVSFFK